MVLLQSASTVCVAGCTLETPAHPLDTGVCLQPVSDLQGCAILLVHSYAQGLHPPQQQEGREGIHCAPQHIVHRAHGCHNICLARQRTCRVNTKPFTRKYLFMGRLAPSLWEGSRQLSRGPDLRLTPPIDGS